MSVDSKLTITKLITEVFSLAATKTVCEVNHCWFDVESKSAVLFDPDADKVYAPELRLVGNSEEAIVEYLKTMGLPAPSHYITKDTPEDDKDFIEASKYVDVKSESTLPEGGVNIDKLEYTRSGNTVIPKIKTPKFAKLFNGDKGSLKELTNRITGLRVTPTKDTTKTAKVVKKTATPAKKVATPEPVEELTVTNEEPTTCPVDEPAIEVPQPAKRSGGRRRVTKLVEVTDDPEPEPVEEQPKKSVGRRTPIRRLTRPSAQN